MAATSDEFRPKNTTSPYTSEAISVKVLPQIGRGFWILAPGQLNFIDSAGVTHNLAAGFFVAGQQYVHQVQEILASTTATGLVLY